jgi:hypothetical protein
VKPSKAALLAEIEELRAAAALVPRRVQRMCSNCGAKSVRIDALACCWNPTDPPLFELPEKGVA